MRRRLDLAMTLVGSPRVIFLDEPTTGLDPRSPRTMWEAIRELVAGGVTIFLTTQYLDEADHLADRIAVLDHGRIVAQGTADELKRRIPGGHVRLQFATLAALHAAAGLLAGAAADEAQHPPQHSVMTKITQICVITPLREMPGAAAVPYLASRAESVPATPSSGSRDPTVSPINQEGRHAAGNPTVDPGTPLPVISRASWSTPSRNTASDTGSPIIPRLPLVIHHPIERLAQIDRDHQRRRDLSRSSPSISRPS